MVRKGTLIDPFFLNQALRMSPPGTQIIAREAQEDTELAGVFIPKGRLVAVDLYELQHSPDIWRDPEVFDPERFARGGEAEQMAGKGLTWIPFSNGAHQCIGMCMKQKSSDVAMVTYPYGYL